ANRIKPVLMLALWPSHNSTPIQKRTLNDRQRDHRDYENYSRRFGNGTTAAHWGRGKVRLPQDEIRAIHIAVGVGITCGERLPRLRWKICLPGDEIGPVYIAVAIEISGHRRRAAARLHGEMKSKNSVVKRGQKIRRSLSRGGEPGK